MSSWTWKTHLYPAIDHHNRVQNHEKYENSLNVAESQFPLISTGCIAQCRSSRCCKAFTCVFKAWPKFLATCWVYCWSHLYFYLLSATDCVFKAIVLNNALPEFFGYLTEGQKHLLQRVLYRASRRGFTLLFYCHYMQFLSLNVIL